MLYRHLYTENKEQFNLKAVLRHSPTESCYLYTNTYIQKDMYQTEMARSYHGSASRNGIYLI